LSANKEEAVLEVSNDGIALPEKFNMSSSKGLGMKIVTMLAKQMGAKVEFSSGKRTSFQIHIPLTIENN